MRTRITGAVIESSCLPTPGCHLTGIIGTVHDRRSDRITSSGMDQRPDVVDEAARILDEAAAAGVVVRLIGGVAVRLHMSGQMHPALARPYADLDLVAGRKRARDVTRLLVDLGYEPNERFNAMSGGTRLVFYDRTYSRHVDVFVGEFRMCHAVAVGDRLDADPRTVPLAELLLTKLQVVQLNEKDLKDIWAIVLEHDVGDHDDDTINDSVIARALSPDWGFWRTVGGTVAAARSGLTSSGLSPQEQHTVDVRLAALWERVEREPKSLRWKSRARIGERSRWYEEPEEIAHAKADE